MHRTEVTHQKKLFQVALKMYVYNILKSSKEMRFEFKFGTIPFVKIVVLFEHTVYRRLSILTL